MKYHQYWPFNFYLYLPFTYAHHGNATTYMLLTTTEMPCHVHDCDME